MKNQQARQTDHQTLPNWPLSPCLSRDCLMYQAFFWGCCGSVGDQSYLAASYLKPCRALPRGEAAGATSPWRVRFHGTDEKNIWTIGHYWTNLKSHPYTTVRDCKILLVRLKYHTPLAAITEVEKQMCFFSWKSLLSCEECRPEWWKLRPWCEKDLGLKPTASLKWGDFWLKIGTLCFGRTLILAAFRLDDPSFDISRVSSFFSTISVAWVGFKDKGTLGSLWIVAPLPVPSCGWVRLVQAQWSQIPSGFDQVHTGSGSFAYVTSVYLCSLCSCFSVFICHCRFCGCILLVWYWFH